MRIGTHIYGWEHGRETTVPASHYVLDWTLKSGADAAQAAEVKKKWEQFRYVWIIKYGREGEVINLLEADVEVNGQLVSRNKPVTASSTHTHYAPKHLVDGNTNTMAHTWANHYHWYRIDLGQLYDFEEGKVNVTIHNRKDCCWDRIRGVVVNLSSDANLPWNGNDNAYLNAFRHPFDANFTYLGKQANREFFKEQGITKFTISDFIPNDVNEAKQSEMTQFYDWTLNKEKSRMLHYRFHGDNGNWDGGRFDYIGNDDIDILEMRGDCKDTLWLYNDHGTRPGNYGNGTVVPVNPGLNALNSWDHYPAHGYFMNQISHLWSRDIPTDKYNSEMDIVGVIRNGHASVSYGNHNADFLETDKFMKQDPKTTLKVAGKHHYPHDAAGAVVGEPCPGGKMHFVNSQKVRCYYRNAAELRALEGTIFPAQANDPRVAMFEDVRSKFCADPENIDEVIKGQKCRVWGGEEETTRALCTSNNHEKLVAGDTNCTRTGMPNEDLYETISEEFCTANPTHDYCKCFNNLNNKCEGEGKSNAGCAEVDQVIDDIIGTLSGEEARVARVELANRRHCFGGVCTSEVDTFVPRSRPDCTLNMCIQDLQVGGHMVESDVEMTCENQLAGSESTMSESDRAALAKDPSRTAFLYEEDGSGNRRIHRGVLIGGGTGVASSSCMCLCMCIIIIMMMPE